MKTPFDEKTSKFYYLNQSCSRGVRIDHNGNRETLPVSLDGVTVRERAVLFWEQCGSFSAPMIRVAGKVVMVFPDSDVSPKKWLPYAVKHNLKFDIQRSHH